VKFHISEPLKKDSPVPLYYQVERALIKWISQNLKPGDLLPSEKELCEAFQVSRIVVRQALGNLVNRGLIQRQRGIGTIVIQPKINEHLVSKLTGFYSDMKSQGLNPKTKLLSSEIIRADDFLAYYLNLLAGEKVMRVHRLRYVNDDPILTVTTYIPCKICPKLLEKDLENRSLYEILEQEYKIRLIWGERVIEAVAADLQDAKLLNVEKGSPLFFLRSITYTENNIPVEYYEAKHRADRTRFITRLFKTTYPDSEEINNVFNSELRLTRFFNKDFESTT
jgi:GntR family transcriptional regulator